MFKKLLGAISDTVGKAYDTGTANFMEGYNKGKEITKDNSTVELLKGVSGKLGAILKGIDKVLNSKEKIASVKKEASGLLDMTAKKIKSTLGSVGVKFPEKETVKSKDEASKESDRTSTAPPDVATVGGVETKESTDAEINPNKKVDVLPQPPSVVEPQTQPDTKPEEATPKPAKTGLFGLVKAGLGIYAPKVKDLTNTLIHGKPELPPASPPAPAAHAAPAPYTTPAVESTKKVDVLQTKPELTPASAAVSVIPKTSGFGVMKAVRNIYGTIRENVSDAYETGKTNWTEGYNRGVELTKDASTIDVLKDVSGKLGTKAKGVAKTLIHGKPDATQANTLNATPSKDSDTITAAKPEPIKTGFTAGKETGKPNTTSEKIVEYIDAKNSKMQDKDSSLKDVLQQTKTLFNTAISALVKQLTPKEAKPEEAQTDKSVEEQETRKKETTDTAKPITGKGAKRSKRTRQRKAAKRAGTVDVKTTTVTQTEPAETTEPIAPVDPKKSKVLSLLNAGKERFTSTYAKLKERMTGRKTEVDAESSDVKKSLIAKTEKKSGGLLGKVLGSVLGGGKLKLLTGLLGMAGAKSSREDEEPQTIEPKETEPDKKPSFAKKMLNKVVTKGKTLGSNLKRLGSSEEGTEEALAAEKKRKDMSFLVERKTSMLEKSKAVKDAAKERLNATMGGLASRMGLRKKEVDEEGNTIKSKPKKKKEDTWMGKILGAIVGLGGTLVSGITRGFGSVLGWAIPKLGTAVMSGIGLLLKGLPGLGAISGGIAKLTQKGVGKAIGGAAKGAWDVLKSKSLWSGVGTAARVAGTVAMRAGGMLLTGPVGWAVGIGTLGYGAYKAYKYLNRNNVSDLVKLRMMRYGLDENMKESYHKLIALEDAVAPFMSLTPGAGYIFKGLNKDLNADIHSIFEISEEDSDYAEKKPILAEWFSKRFFPVFKSHLDALYNTDSKIKFDDIDKLDKTLVADYIAKMGIPPQVYTVTKLVNKTIQDIVITQSQIQDYEKALTDKAKAEAVKKGKTTVKPVVMPPPVKPAAPPVPVPANKIDPAKSTNTVEDLEAPKPLANKDLDVKPDPKLQQAYSQDTTKPEGKDAIAASKPLNTLGGPMVAPTSDLEGIKLGPGIDSGAIYNLDPNVKQLFTSMAAEYKKLTGNDIQVNEGFRTREHQAMLYAKYPGKAAKPGNSTHEFGLAVDVNSETSNKLDEMGLLRKYGFTRPIGGELWHLEPAGVSLDPVRAKSNDKAKLEAVEASVGKGGGGYATLPNATMKRRNIPYQVSLFAQAKDNKIDFKTITKQEKSPLADAKPIVVAKTDTKTAPAPAAGAPSTVVAKSETAGNNAQIAEDTAPPKGATTPVSTDKSTQVAYNKATDLSSFKDLTPQQAIQKASELTGVDAKTLTRFAEMESSMRPSVKAGTSNATGLFQFVPDTWKYMLAKHGNTYNIPAGAKPDNPLYSAILGAQYIKDNLKEMGPAYKQTGMDDSTAAYMAHHYGPSGASKFINAYATNPDAKVQQVASPKAYAANKQELGDNTVKSYIAQVTAKVNKTPNMAGDQGSVQTALYKPEDKAAAPKAQAAVYKAPGSSDSASSTTPSPGMQTALYKPSTGSAVATDKSTPAVTTSAYTYSAPTATPAKVDTTLNKTASTTTIDMTTMESIAGKQLAVLENIRDLITSISGKAPSQVTPATPKGTTPPSNNNRMLSNERVDVSRKVYT